MADQLKQFSDLFTELQTEVDVLQKQKTDISKELVTKEARLAYLNGAIVQTEKTLDQAKKKQQTAIAELEQNVQDLKTERAQADKAIVEAKLELEVVTSEAQAVTENSEAEAKRLETIITDKQQQVAVLEVQISKAKESLEKIRKEITESKGVLTVLDDEIAAKQTESDAKMAELNTMVAEVVTLHRDAVAKLDEKQDELEAITEKVDQLQVKHDSLAKKITDFADYESRAKKALQAREQALIEGEANLADARRRARSSGILDNI